MASAKKNTVSAKDQPPLNPKSPPESPHFAPEDPRLVGKGIPGFEDRVNAKPLAGYKKYNQGTGHC